MDHDRALQRPTLQGFVLPLPGDFLPGALCHGTITLHHEPSGIVAAAAFSHRTGVRARQSLPPEVQPENRSVARQQPTLGEP